MSLLDEIVDLSVKDDVSISVLLRKCLVLAAKLKNDKLREWANFELNGYPKNDDLPPYRVIPIQARGHFEGTFGRSVRFYALAPGNMPEGLSWWAETCYLAHPVATLDNLIQGDEGSIKTHWPQDLVLAVNDAFIEDHALVQAWQHVPRPSIVGVLDTVRHRVLSLALEMQQEIGNTDDALTKADATKVDQQVTAYIFGGNNVIAGAATHVSQQNLVNVTAGDFNSLAAALRNIGVDGGELSALNAAIKSDPAKPANGSLGVGVSAWLGKMAVKAAKGALKVGVDVGSKIATEALLKYYGGA